MKLSHPVSRQQESEIEEVVVAFDGTDQIRMRFLESARYDDTTKLILTMTVSDWQTVASAVEDAM